MQLVNTLFLAFCIFSSCFSLSLRGQTSLELDQSNAIYNSFKTVHVAGANTNAVKQSWWDKTDEQFIHDITNSPQIEGYCTKENIDLSNYSNHQTCGGPKTEIGFIILLRFCVNAGDTVTIRSYHDFGSGGIITWNGEIAIRYRNDLWWGGSDLNNPSLAMTKTFTEKSVQQIEIYGADQCCDGNQIIRLKVNNGDFQYATVSQIDANCQSLGLDISSLPPLTPVPLTPEPVDTSSEVCDN
jgi:hypothetical protein